MEYMFDCNANFPMDRLESSLNIGARLSRVDNLHLWPFNLLDFAALPP